MSTIRHPAIPRDDDEELFTEFVNTLQLERGVAQEGLPDGRALRGWLVARGLPSRPRIGVDRLAEFHRLRELIRASAERVVGGRRPTAAQLRALNGALRLGLHYHRLDTDDGGRLAYVGAQAGDPLDRARAAIADSFAQFLAGDETDRLRICGNAGCRWLFVDRSPTGRRVWCDMRTCGNRAKVARHRARARAADAG